MADPGFVKREGRESKCLKKSLRGRGTPTHFFPQILFWRHLHYGVGVPSTYQTEHRGEKQKKKSPPPQKKKKKKKKKIGQKRGRGRGQFAPPWIRHWLLFRGVRASVRKSEMPEKWWFSMHSNCIRSLKMGFCEEQKKVWNQINIWTLTSLTIQRCSAENQKGAISIDFVQHKCPSGSQRQIFEWW